MKTSRVTIMLINRK